MGRSHHIGGLTSQTEIKALRNVRPWLTTATLANCLVLAISIAVLLGWGFGIPKLTTLLVGRTPISPVAAVALLLSSISVILLGDGTSRWRSMVAAVLALAVLGAGVAVLSEYLFGLSLRVEETLFRHSLERQTLSNSGRVAPNTALNLALMGAALLLFVSDREKARRIAQFLTVAAGLIAFCALLGYAYGEHYLYQVSEFRAMSLPAAVAFLLLCTAMLTFRPPRQGFVISLGVTLLLAVVAVNSIVALLATKRLIDNQSRVEHTRMVAQELDGTLTALLNIETAERGYLYTGEREYFQAFELAEAQIGQHLHHLTTLMAGNRIQEQNLGRLLPLVQDAMTFFQQAVTLEAAGQHKAGKQHFLSGGGNTKMDAVRRVLGEMKGEELKLLATRTVAAQRSAQYLFLAIPASLVFTALLLMLAGLLVKRDIGKRTQTVRRFRELSEREREARRRAEAAHQLTESVLSSISEMFMLVDRNWRVVYLNEQATKLIGKTRANVVGEDYWQVIPETLGTKFEEAYRQCAESQIPATFEAFDERLQKWFSVRLYPSEDVLTIFAQDVTFVKHTQEALVRSEKLAAVGRMAATVAHEINNPLEAITNLIWIASYDSSASENVRRHLALADEELRRVAEITKQTLGFYRDTSAPMVVDMRDVMTSVLDLYMRRLTNKQVSVRKEFENCVVYGYRGELRQLFSNLCANAIDAVQNGGKLVLRISHCRAWGTSTQPGIRVTIADDGCGIAAEHQGSLFQPFFSTKKTTGTGLGLWVAKQIAEKHGGWITLRSNAEPDSHYTAVSVFLPTRSGRIQ